MSALAAAPATTSNDQRYLAKLRTHWKANKSFPSLAKLADLLGMSSTGSVFEMVARLEDAGYLTRKDGRVAPGKRFFAYPVLGTVRAGVPQPASDEEFEFLSVEELLIREPNKTAMCHVRGDSMKDAGLLDGDVVIVETNSIVEAGDIGGGRGRWSADREVPAQGQGRHVLPRAGERGLRAHPPASVARHRRPGHRVLPDHQEAAEVTH